MSCVASRGRYCRLGSLQWSVIGTAVGKSPEEGIHSDRYKLKWNLILKKKQHNRTTTEISTDLCWDLNIGGKSSFLLRSATQCSAVYSYLDERASMVVTSGTTWRNQWTIRRNTAPISFFFSTSAPCKYTITYTNKPASFMLREMLRGQIQPFTPPPPPQV